MSTENRPKPPVPRAQNAPMPAPRRPETRRPVAVGRP